MKYYALIFIIAIATALLAKAVEAGEIDRPLAGGTITVKQMAQEGPDALRTKSIATRRVLTGEVVLCLDVPTGGGIVEGTTDVIANDSQVVLLEGISFTEVGCVGVASLPSRDTYKVTFGLPLAPVLMQVTP